MATLVSVIVSSLMFVVELIELREVCFGFGAWLHDWRWAHFQFLGLSQVGDGIHAFATLTGPARLILLHHCRNVYDGDRGSLGRLRKFTVEYLVDRIIYALRSGCPWRMLPVGRGSYKTIFAWFNKFSKLNVLRGRFMTLKSGIGRFGGAILLYML